jgi:hypothetical protein
MVAVNTTATLWSKRLVMAARQRTQSPGVDGVTPNCCWIVCNICCYVTC